MRAVCNSRPSGFDERTTTNTPPSAASPRVEERIERGEPQVAMRRDRIDAQRRGRGEVTFSISGSSRVDVAALAIEQHQHFARARQLHELFQRAKAGAAEALEECRLRLEHDDAKVRRLEHALAELQRAFRGIRQAAGLQQRRRRIDADAQRAVLVDFLLQAVGKRRHAAIVRRATALGTCRRETSIPACRARHAARLSGSASSRVRLARRRAATQSKARPS